MPSSRRYVTVFTTIFSFRGAPLSKTLTRVSLVVVIRFVVPIAGHGIPFDPSRKGYGLERNNKKIFR